MSVLDWVVLQIFVFELFINLKASPELQPTTVVKCSVNSILLNGTTYVKGALCDD